MAKRKKMSKCMSEEMAEVTHGVEWLSQLTETIFRDDVLKDLFTQMKKQKAIVDFNYTHGRNEHGVDWIVIERGTLSDRFVGIQAKSKPVTKQGDSNSESALSIKLQCDSAFDHRFNWNGNDIRVDNVELWMSAHITADATEEFHAPVARHKIAVKRAEQIFALIERYCPKIAANIPGLAEADYLRQMANPAALPIRILGIPLNPKKHFLEPRFSRHDDLSLARVFDKRKRQMREEDPIYLESLLSNLTDTIFIGSPLSGKTYLLRRISCLLAEQGLIPVYADASIITEKSYKSVIHLISTHLTWHSLSTLSNAEQLNRYIVMLVDNSDCLTEEQILKMRSTTHSRVKFVLVGRSHRNISGFQTLFISGIKTGSIPSFVRSLDIDTASASALTDRATNYIQRTIGTSGLPTNPFTVSVMLQECHVAKRKLATPTMGRLIERFVEGQIGSHSDIMRVDYETKQAFLTNLGGKNKVSFSSVNFRKYVAQFLSKHGHAHDLTDFENDLLDSGLLCRDSTSAKVCWTHPIFQEFFWVRNMVREKKYAVLAKNLVTSESLRIAAITGSQMGNAHKVLSVVLEELGCKDWMMTNSASKQIAKRVGEINFPLPSDEDEETLLQHIETTANDLQDPIPSEQEAKELQENNPENITELPANEDLIQGLSVYVSRMVEEKHFLAANVASLLLNARGLPRRDKENAVLCVLRSTTRMGKHFSDMLHTLSNKRMDPFMADVYSMYWCLMILDSLIGDAFLSEVFRGIMKYTKQDDEKLALTDLLVACGCDSPSSYVSVISGRNRMSVAVAVYMRLVTTYFFRFHKPEEKAALKEAMKEVRKLAKGISLPPIK